MILTFPAFTHDLIFYVSTAERCRLLLYHLLQKRCIYICFFGCMYDHRRRDEKNIYILRTSYSRGCHRFPSLVNSRYLLPTLSIVHPLPTGTPTEDFGTHSPNEPLFRAEFWDNGEWRCSGWDVCPVIPGI